MTKQAQLTKTCIVCGVQKPLAAFLQMTGPQGTIYGNVCTSCRGTTAKPNEVINLKDEGRGSTSSGLRIDSTARNLAEIKDKKFEHDRDEEKREDREKKDKFTLEKTEQIDKRQEAERDHRYSYIEARQRQGFMPFQNKKQTEKKQFIAKQLQENKNTIERHQKTLENQKNIAAKEENRLNTFDPSSPIVGSGYERRFQSAIFLSYLEWLGFESGAPIVQMFKQLQPSHSMFHKESENKTPTLNNEDPINFTNRSWRNRN